MSGLRFGLGFVFGLGVRVGLGLRFKIRKLRSYGRSLGAGFIRETGMKDKMGCF